MTERKIANIMAEDIKIQESVVQKSDDLSAEMAQLDRALGKQQVLMNF